MSKKDAELMKKNEISMLNNETSNRSTKYEKVKNCRQIAVIISYIHKENMKTERNTT